MKNKYLFLIGLMLVSIFLISEVSAFTSCTPSDCVSPYTDSDGVTTGFWIFDENPAGMEVQLYV